MKLQVSLAPEAQAQLSQLADQVEEQSHQVQRHVREVVAVSSLRVEGALRLVALGLFALAVVLYLNNQERDANG